MLNSKIAMDTLQFVKELAVKAGGLIVESRNKFRIFPKKVNDDRHDIVTTVDYDVENFIVEHLKEEFPEYDIFSEEMKKPRISTDFFWAIDPVDGTKNFAAGIPLVGISIALVHNQIPILGVIYNPFVSELYYADKSKGAFCNDEKISVARTEKLSDSMIIIEGAKIYQLDRKYPGRIHLSSRATRDFGCATLDLAYLAHGKVEGYIDEDLKYYDIAAGAVILEEAGGKITDTQGKSLFPRTPGRDDIPVVASNKLMHNRLLEEIAKG